MEYIYQKFTLDVYATSKSPRIIRGLAYIVVQERCMVCIPFLFSNRIIFRNKIICLELVLKLGFFFLQIQQLVDMGFSRDRAENALRLTNNDTAMATNILLQEA